MPPSASSHSQLTVLYAPSLDVLKKSRAGASGRRSSEEKPLETKSAQLRRGQQGPDRSFLFARACTLIRELVQSRRGEQIPQVPQTLYDCPCS